MQYLLCCAEGEKRAFAHSADARGRFQRKWNSEWTVSLKQLANEDKSRADAGLRPATRVRDL
jgi:hypothetical protein